MLLDTEPEATGVGEVLALELVLLHLEPSLEDLQRLVPADLDHPIHSNTNSAKLLYGSQSATKCTVAA